MGRYSGEGLELLSTLPLRRLRQHMSTQNHRNHDMISKYATVHSSASDCASTLGDLPRCDGDNTLRRKVRTHAMQQYRRHWPTS